MNTLNTYLISAPLSALLSIISGLSIAIVFDHLGRRIFKSDDPVFTTMYFLAGLLVLSWIVWVICLLSLAEVWIFKALIWLMISYASYLILTKQSRSIGDFIFKKYTWSKETYLKALLIFIFSCYTLLSLTVPTDSDSLSYHLALPVEILNNGNLYFNKDNLHFRMAGFGEMLNLLGLANGAPQLSAFIQIIALFYMLRALAANTVADQRLNLVTLYLGVPTLVFLIPNQKHQLTGLLCTSVCFLALSRALIFTPARLTLLLSVLLFAAGIKYSFLLSFTALLLFFILKKSDGISLHHFVKQLVVLTAIILGPQLLFKCYLLGDPISPLLESFMPTGDPIVIKLHRYIKNYKDSSYPFPVNLIFTNSAGNLSTIIGVAAITLVLLPFLIRLYKAEVVTIIFLIGAILIGGQASSRFLTEPVFWCIPLAIATFSASKYYPVWIFIARLQLLVLAPLLCIGIYNLGPSLINDFERNEVMSKASSGYAESIWINQMVPANARICIASRSRAYLPRTYFPWEYLFFTSMENKEEADLLNYKLKQEYKIDYLILPSHGFEEIRTKYAGDMIAGPKKFYTATRNPLNRMEYEIAIYKMK